ncbi:alpha-galactosidase [Promicromonospora sukumoe]|uniref:alpha-galactosidase n=1 Tax=Promicromonospora sukumoe TaxID=88382 RepID=A0A7W3J6X2_9MICO|nr:alpha-galactosidase [Promicromonospora sukumoe]MBA8807264.1 alpha-galactosidase [Promicromonospora sukumoe]
MSAGEEYAVLRAAGVSLVLDLVGAVPQVLHWGEDLGELGPEGVGALRATGVTARVANSPETPRALTLLPVERDAWSGLPGIEGHRGGTATTPRPELVEASVVVPDGGVGGVVRLNLREPVADLALAAEVELEATGVLRVRWTVTAGEAAGEVYDLSHVTALLPLPARAVEVLDFSGRWSRERQPQRLPLVDGAHVREVRRGKPGVDSPYLLAVGTPGFGNRSGEVWAAHVAWSGDQRWIAQRLHEGAGAHAAVLGGGELLRSGEVRLAARESYTAPDVLFAWSDAGLDGIADRFHRRTRARRPRTGPQPLVLNTWEAVYFDHDLARLGELVDRAARIGVERIVLDDGWFRGRRDDTAGLGDWQVEAAVWPDGLDPFVNRVRQAGMEFGLWFEPEMVSLDSDLAREHPEWLLAPSAGVGTSFRNQYVLDVAHPGAYAYLLDAISAVVERYGVDYIKWDHNRDLLEAVVRDGAGDRPGVRRQTLALYALLDELRERHPALEIESCAAGGGRVDLGILDHTDRVWASDCNDPVERQQIQRWTEVLLPPELLGSHVGAARSHTTHRVTDLSFRLVTTAFAAPGIEWDITGCTEDEMVRLSEWAAFVTSRRGLLHGGVRVHADLADEQTLLHGTVSQDRTHALFAWVRLASSAGPQVARVPFPGLDRDRDYVVRLPDAFGPIAVHGREPAWMERARSSEGFRVPGAVLASAGVTLPVLQPASGLVLELTAA